MPPSEDNIKESDAFQRKFDFAAKLKSITPGVLKTCSRLLTCDPIVLQIGSIL